MYVPRSNFVCFFPISKPWHDTRLISLISRSAVLKSFEWKLFQIKFYSGKPQRNNWIGFITCMYGCNILPGGAIGFNKLFVVSMFSSIVPYLLGTHGIPNVPKVIAPETDTKQIQSSDLWQRIVWSTCCFRWGGRAVEKIQNPGLL